MAKRQRGLGRGLDALLGGDMPVYDESEISAEPEEGKKLPQTLPVEFLERGKYQPRREMNQDALQELADSIQQQGIMQPLVVREVGESRYEIVAGERRWRAAQLAGLHDVPVIVRELSDEATIAMALIENIQREDLNPMEQAIALDRLKREFDLTQEAVAKAVGKNRATVANLLRLMSLNEDVKQMLDSGSIELGHAKLFLPLEPGPQSAIAREVAQKELTVRQTEVLIKNYHQGVKTTPVKESPDVLRLQEELSERVGLPVKIQQMSGGKGKFIVSYSSLDELDGLLSHIK